MAQISMQINSIKHADFKVNCIRQGTTMKEVLMAAIEEFNKKSKSITKSKNQNQNEE